MSSNCAVCLVIGLGAFLTALPGRASDEGTPSANLPKPLDPAFAKHLLENSPFTRVVNPSESLRLTGVAVIEGKTVVTVKDHVANKTHVVTEEPNEQGWKLVEVWPDSRIEQAEVKIMIGSELVAIHYSAAQMAPAKKSGYMPSKIPTAEEFTGRDDKGAYVRGMPYLTDADREKMREVPREVRDKFLQIVHDQRAMLFKASHEERAAFVKKAYDSVVRR
jgi:hypothetical protein